jgi:RNA methyltransferase, TrmH family
MADPIGVRHQSMQRLRRLSGRRSARSEEGAFVIDGPTLLAEALDAGTRVDEVVAAPGCPDDLLARAAAAGATVRRTRAGDLARVVDTVTPQGVAAVARIPGTSPAEAAAGAGPLALVLVSVGDPGNAGTLMRSAEAAGAGAVLFCDDAVDPFGPKCVRSSAGSLFRLAVVRACRWGDAAGALAAAGVRTVATLARGAPPYDDADLADPVAVVLGSEAHGLPDHVAAGADAAVTIPMAGRAESLNVAMAGTILCFEAARQRRSRTGGTRRSGTPGNRLDETPPRAAGCSTR